MGDSKLEGLQTMQLMVLKEVDRICKKHNIQYYLSWGSALGAIRHKGFIPWDDDIDVSMPWKDYVRFKKICTTELNEKYFLQNTDTDKFFWNSWDKIRINNTTSMDKNLDYMRCHYGICIDIFPIIGIPSSEKERKKQGKFTALYKMLCSEAYYCNVRDENQSALKKKYKFTPKFIKRMLKKIALNQITKYDMDSVQLWGEILSEPYEVVKKIDKNIYGKGKEIQFENFTTVVPEKTHEYLTEYYGDYMQLPKESERQGHGETIIDLETSYEKYCTYNKSKN